MKAKIFLIAFALGFIGAAVWYLRQPKRVEIGPKDGCLFGVTYAGIGV